MRLTAASTETGFLVTGSLLALTALFLTGCGKSDVQVYRAPKEATPPPPMASHGMAAHGGENATPKVSWTLPSGWTEKPASGMRAGSFVIAGADGAEAEVAILPFAGMKAPTAEVVNLWREQLGLKPLTEGEVGKEAQAVKVGDTAGQLFDLVSAGSGDNQKQSGHIVVAMVYRDGVAWFFKLTGADPLVAQQKVTFVQFLESIRYAPATGQPDAVAAAGTVGVSPEPIGAPKAGSAASGSLPEWKVPEGWQAQPAPPMALAGFLIPGSGATTANLSVTILEGGGGGLLANVNRWRGQLGLAPLDEAGLAKTSEELPLDGRKMVLVDMSGKNSRTAKPARLVGAIVTVNTKTWFFKLLGDDAVVAKEKPALVEFVKSVKFPNG